MISFFLCTSRWLIPHITYIDPLGVGVGFNIALILLNKSAHHHHSGNEQMWPFCRALCTVTDLDQSQTSVLPILIVLEVRLLCTMFNTLADDSTPFPQQCVPVVVDIKF